MPERAAYKDAATAQRAAMEHFIAVRPEARWKPAETDLFMAVLWFTASFSKLSDWVMMKQLVAVSGHHRRTCGKSLKKLREFWVIGYAAGVGRRGTWVSIADSERGVARPPLTRRSSAASQTPNEDSSGSSRTPPQPPEAASNAAEFGRLRGGDMWPPLVPEKFIPSETSREDSLEGLPTLQGRRNAADADSAVPVESGSSTSEPGGGIFTAAEWAILERRSNGPVEEDYSEVIDADFVEVDEA